MGAASRLGAGRRRAFRFRTLLVITVRQAGQSTRLHVLVHRRMHVDGAPLVLGTAQDLGLAEETWTGTLHMAESVLERAREVAHVFPHQRGQEPAADFR